MSYPIEVIGLGAGDIDQLPLGIYKKIKQTTNLFVRTMDHPVIKGLEKEGIMFHSFDAYYEEEEQFEDVYINIVNTLLTEAEENEVIYAVPGHPMLAEYTVQLLLAQAKVEVNILGGHSYLDALFTTLQIDPIEGFQFVDGTSFKRSELNYRQHLIFCQVYDAMIASHIKLTLLEDLPANYMVKVVIGAGSSEEKIMTVPLKELDHSLEVNNLMTIYVPPAPKKLLHHTFAALREVIATLRGPEGCEWDKRQTHESLRPYAIEEVFELIDAIDAEDDEGMIEELGDVLLQVMLHSQIGEDVNYFSIDDVILGITNKMIHRHPHVFNDADSVEGPLKSWDELKNEEKDSEIESVLENISESLPSLTKAYQLQANAAKVGFDWDDVNDMWLKLEEELAEVSVAIKQQNKTDIEAELGDVIFVLANISRYYNIDPEIALNRTNKKFLSRFQHIEQRLLEQGKDITKTTLEEMDRYWDEAKGEE